MKKFLLGTVGLVALGISAPASAADLPAAPAYRAAPAYIPAQYDWSGFYSGINGGWGSSRKCWDRTDAAGVFIAAEGCHDAGGAIAGLQLGFRWQMGSWVFGLEAQGDWSDMRGSNTSLFAPANSNRSRIDSFGLFTGQVGFAFNDALLYVKGGAAITEDHFNILDIPSQTIAASTTNNQTRFGGTAGIGFEYAFIQNWSVGAEYDHLFMGNKLSNFTTPATLPFSNDRIRQDADIFTLRVNYRWGGPVIAKY